MTAPTLFGKTMLPDPVAEGWTAQVGLYAVAVINMLGGGFRGSIQYGSRFEVLKPHNKPELAAAECEAWLMRTMLTTATEMGFELQRTQ